MVSKKEPEKKWDISGPGPMPPAKRVDPYDLQRLYEDEDVWLDATTSEGMFTEGAPMMYLAVVERWSLLADTAVWCRDKLIVRAVKAGHSNRAVAAAARLTHPTIAKIVRAAGV